MGAGYQFMDQAMYGQFTWRVLALLAAFKIISTSLSFVSGTPGGMFAPTLFIGAMIGGAVGGIEHRIFPWLSGSVGAYALVGMGTLFAGFLRAPMTSVFMVLEVSGNYSIILPVMISNTVAYMVSRHYQPTPLFDLLSRQDGLDLPSMEERREASALRVEDAMQTYRGPILRGEDVVADALLALEKSGESLVLVANREGHWGGLTAAELRRRSAEAPGQTLGSFLADVRLPHLHPDQILDEALRRFGDFPLLPIVSRADFGKLEGVVTLQDILRVYRTTGSGLAQSKARVETAIE